MRSRVSLSICSETSVICQDSSSLNVQLFGGLSKRKCELALRLMLRCSNGLLGRARLVQAVAEPQRIEARQIQKREECRNKQSAHDRDRHRAPEGRARQ